MKNILIFEDIENSNISNIKALALYVFHINYLSIAIWNILIFDISNINHGIIFIKTFLFPLWYFYKLGLLSLSHFHVNYSKISTYKLNFFLNAQLLDVDNVTYLFFQCDIFYYFNIKIIVVFSICISLLLLVHYILVFSII